jgi:two-component system, NarL family, sensor histidine kinase DegS
MSIKQIDMRTIDQILEKMIDTVGNSKNEIFEIGEQCRKDYESILDELEKIKEMITKVIDDEEKLDQEVRFARKRLAEVSKHFKSFSEEEVRVAYENAHNLQIKLSSIRQLEQQLRERRDDLERRLTSVKETIQRADHLVSQISVVLNYLTGDLKQIGEFIQDAKAKQEFGLRIIEAQEEERKRLSREIHDGPAQMLANVIMRSDLVEKVFRERGTEEGLKEIRSLKTMVRDALYEVRHIIYDLRPMALDDLGLVPTLKKYLQTVEEYNQSAKVTFTNIGVERRVPEKLEAAMFRLIQEAVQNAFKHSEASHIHVKLEMNKDNIIAIIKDDGKGFDISKKIEGSYGLIGMRERVDLLNGELTVDSKIGFGTVILIRVPLP